VTQFANALEEITINVNIIAAAILITVSLYKLLLPISALIQRRPMSNGPASAHRGRLSTNKRSGGEVSADP